MDHWPLAQVDCLRPTGLQARTTSNVVPALRTAETPLKYGSSDRFSMHTWKVTASLTSMAAGFTPGHDWSRHAVIDVLVDAWQSWADVYEESSMASWAQRLSRVIVGNLVAPKGSLFCGARRVGRVSERPPRHANARPGLRSRWQAIGALSGRHGRRHAYRVRTRCVCGTGVWTGRHARGVGWLTVRREGKYHATPNQCNVVNHDGLQRCTSVTESAQAAAGYNL